MVEMDSMGRFLHSERDKMDDKHEKQRHFLWHVLYWGVVIALVYVGCKYFLPLIGPFVLGFIMACLIKPAVDFMQKRWHLKRAIAAIVCVVLFYGVIGLLLVLSGVRLVAEAQEIIVNMPRTYSTRIAPIIAGMFDWMERIIQRFDPNLHLNIDETARMLSERLGQLVSSFSTRAITGTAKFAGGIPSFMVQVIFSVLSTFYIANDYTAICDFVCRQLPERGVLVLKRGKQQLGATLSKYVRSYAIILGITFAELCVGFSILHIKSAGGWALLIAFFDILPVVGTSLVLVPWTIISFLQGNIARGIGLAIITVVVWVVRNILEPKIVGDQVGLHPLLTLMAMYVGARLFGGIGLLGLPVTLAILNALQKEGTISIYK